MPTNEATERIENLVERYTNAINEYPEVTEKVRADIVSLAESYGVDEEYPIEKMAKSYAEPIYYLRKSLEHQMGVDPSSLRRGGATPQEIEKAQKKRDRVQEKLMNQTNRQFRFWTTFINSMDR
jgi:hypothetical protein